VSNARRTLLLVALLVLYFGSALRPVIEDRLRHGAFHPLLPPARVLEQRLAEERFAEALSLARDRDRTYPREAQIALWLARIHHGLNDAGAEATAWERYVMLSPAPEEACPALPEAYARAGRPAESRDASARCAAFDDADVLRSSDTQ
jgi:hypothetical protein